jgi:PAS domain S-box-containing protein
VVTFENEPHILGVVKDITELKEVEDRLKESEERFRTTFQLSPDVMAISRISDGVYVDINDAFTRIIGYDKDEVIGRSALGMTIWAYPEKREELVDLLKSEGIIENVEVEFRKKDGTIFPGLSSCQVVTFENEPHLLVIVKDITQLKQAWEELQAQKEELKVLRELLPICSYCKNIQDDEGYWEKVESYISRYTSAELSHGICPGCARKHFPQIDWDEEEE